jgi:hypothetical protein
MKRLENQFKVKRLFVLGAGASFSASKTRDVNAYKTAPLDNVFCKRIYDTENTVKKPVWVSSSCKLLREKWLDNKKFEDYGLEEAVSEQLGHIDFLRAVYKRRSRSVITVANFLNHLSHLIVFILNKSREREGLPYSHFVDKVFPSSFDNCVDRIITFNYDTLLDQYLLRRFVKEQVYFDGIKDNPRSSKYRRLQCDAPLMIKLHGSINWRCTVGDFTRIIGASDDSSSNDSHMEIWTSSKIPKPTDNVSPLIIPPLPAKPLSRIDIFKWLWTKAFEYLQQAEEIVICGYSLPEFDQYAKSLFINVPISKLRKVTIVDPDTSMLGKWAEVFRRKKIRDIQWQWAEDFTDYVKSGLKANRVIPYPSPP